MRLTSISVRPRRRYSMGHSRMGLKGIPRTMPARARAGQAGAPSQPRRSNAELDVQDGLALLQRPGDGGEAVERRGAIVDQPLAILADNRRPQQFRLACQPAIK